MIVTLAPTHAYVAHKDENGGITFLSFPYHVKEHLCFTPVGHPSLRLGGTKAQVKIDGWFLEFESNEAAEFFAREFAARCAGVEFETRDFLFNGLLNPSQLNS